MCFNTVAGMGKSTKFFYISLRVITYVQKTLDVGESHQVLAVEKDYILCELRAEC